MYDFRRMCAAIRSIADSVDSTGSADASPDGKRQLKDELNIFFGEKMVCNEVVVTCNTDKPMFGAGAVLMSIEWLKDKAKTAVRITETLTRTVLVDTDYENAEDIVADAYYKGVVMLTPDNSTVEVNIEDDTENYKELFGDDIFDYLEVSGEFKKKEE